MEPDTYELDVFVRHQIYIEQYKNGQTEAAREQLDALGALIALLLLKRGVDSLADLTRRQFDSLLSELTRRVNQILRKFGTFTVSTLKQFAAANMGITQGTFAAISKKKPAPVTAANMWAQIERGLVPGVGEVPRNMLKAYFGSVLADVQRAVKIAYTNKWPIQATIQRFTGTVENDYRDGLLNKFRNQFETVFNTYTQYINVTIQAYIGRMFFARYRWVSVLDDRTTDYCWNQHDHIYEYGAGPLPPAHYNCRSTIMPVTDKVPANDNVPTYYEWVKTQPVAVQNDALGARRAVALRKGELKAKDLAKYTNARTLTLADYKDKRKQILTKT